MADAILTADRLREVLHYNAETGVFIWVKRLSNRAVEGSVAGALNRHTGYTSISIGGKLHRAHRLAFLYMTGAWPPHHIDHVNGSRSDNRWENLRPVSVSVNQQNLRSARGDTHSGVLGVHRTDKKSKPWCASIKVDGKERHIGNFETIEDASSAYIAAKRRLHEGCSI